MKRLKKTMGTLRNRFNSSPYQPIIDDDQNNNNNNIKIIESPPPKKNKKIRYPLTENQNSLLNIMVQIDKNQKGIDELKAMQEENQKGIEKNRKGIDDVKAGIEKNRKGIEKNQKGIDEVKAMMDDFEANFNTIFEEKLGEFLKKNREHEKTNNLKNAQPNENILIVPPENKDLKNEVPKVKNNANNHICDRDSKLHTIEKWIIKCSSDEDQETPEHINKILFGDYNASKPSICNNSVSTLFNSPNDEEKPAQKKSSVNSSKMNNSN